jgi:hypothetical protein
MDIGKGLPATIPWTNAPLILEWAKRADSSPFSRGGGEDCEPILRNCVCQRPFSRL